MQKINQRKVSYLFTCEKENAAFRVITRNIKLLSLPYVTVVHDTLNLISGFLD